MTETDLELLKRYAHERAEDAFAEIVRRHLDLVYSTALRQVRSPQLAEEISQSAFLDLARNGPQLQPDTVVAAWLYQVTRRAAIDVVRREARRQLREQIATEMNTLNAPAADWTRLEPLLDEAMAALDATDRAAVLLRYFENQSLREVGQQLGVTDDAAQKRVSRAVDRLRAFFAQRGVSVGAGGLAVLMAANAVQAAPVGLAITISSAAAPAGASLATTATATTTKAIAMTTLQKTLITTAFVAAVSTALYEARHATLLNRQVRTLQQQQTALATQNGRLRSERADTASRLASLAEENASLRSNQNYAELLRLRGEIGVLRSQNQQLAHEVAGRTNSLPALHKGFGSLGEYLPIESVYNAGTQTPEALLRTFIYAMREGDIPLLEKLGAPLTGQIEPGDVAGHISKANAAVFQTIRSAFTNATGFRLSSQPSKAGDAYEVRLDAASSPDQSDPGIQNFHLQTHIEKSGDAWILGSGQADE